MFPDARAPKRIGDYRVLRRIREDGPFEVYVAKDEGALGFEREVTLRCVRRESDDEHRATELAREAKICARLNHPSIVRVIDLIEEGDRYVLVLEHVEGVSLGTLIGTREEPFTVGAAAYIAATVASALAAAHALRGEDGTATPVLHRALSPSVVHVAQDGTVRLGGFGLAKILDRTPDSVAGLLGTSGIVAPEVLRNQPNSAKSDVYSLAALAYALFVPRHKRSSLEALGGRIPSLASTRPDLPRELVAAIDAGLEPDPAKRSIDCAEMARWVEHTVPLEEGRKDLRDMIESLPPELVEQAGGRTSRRQRSIERQSRARHELLRRSSTGVGDDDLELEVEEDVPELPPTSGRVQTMLGMGAVVAPVTRPALAKQPSGAVEIPKIEEAPAPAIAIVSAPAIAPAPAPAIAPAPAPAPAFEVEAKPRSRGWIGAVVAGIALIVIGVELLVRPRSGDAHPPLTKSTNATSESASEVKSDVKSAPVPPPEPEKSAPPVASASTAIEAPKTKLPKNMGWLFVHTDIAGRVYVAGRSRGEPNKVLMAPCGKMYVNLAKVDAKGTWRGWAAKGKNAEIPCDGKVAEVTLSAP